MGWKVEMKSSFVSGSLVLVAALLFFAAAAAAQAPADDPKELFIRGREEYNKGNLKEALDYWEKVIKLDPAGNVYAYYNIGLIYENWDNLDKALEYYKKSADMKSDDPDVFASLGYTYYLLKNYPEAEFYFKKSIETNKEYTKGYYWLGKVLYDSGNANEALAVWEDLLKIDPTNYNTMAQIEKVKKSQKDVNDPHFHYRSGIRYYYIKDYSEAARSFEKAVSLKDDFIAAHYWLARSLGNLGDFDAAVRECEAVLRLDPNYKDAREDIKSWQKKKQSVKKIFIGPSGTPGDTAAVPQSGGDTRPE